MQAPSRAHPCALLHVRLLPSPPRKGEGPALLAGGRCRLSARRSDLVALPVPGVGAALPAWLHGVGLHGVGLRGSTMRAGPQGSAVTGDAPVVWWPCPASLRGSGPARSRSPARGAAPHSKAGNGCPCSTPQHPLAQPSTPLHSPAPTLHRPEHPNASQNSPASSTTPCTSLNLPVPP